MIANQFFNVNDNPKYQTGRFSDLDQYSDLSNAALGLGSGGSVYEHITNKVKNNPKLDAIEGSIPFSGVAENVMNGIFGLVGKGYNTQVSDWLHGTHDVNTTKKINNFSEYKEHLKKIGGL